MEDSQRWEQRPQRLPEAAEAWLVSLTARGCSPHTIARRTGILASLQRAVGDSLASCTTPCLSAYLSRLRKTGRKPETVWTHANHMHAFFAWCVEAGLLDSHPMRGLVVKRPKTLPRVPEDEAVRHLLRVCPETWEGRRNRALVALLADSALRISEALRLRIEDVNFATRTIMVHGGKGAKDGVSFFGAETAQHLRAWLIKRPQARPEDYLFIGRMGRSLSRRRALDVLHRLSRRAGLAARVSPHQLRHYAATSILRQTGDLELVRQVLRHETLTMALRYAHLTRPDVNAKFRRASPLDNLRAGR